MTAALLDSSLSQQETKSFPKEREVNLLVEGMHCSSCVAKLEQSLNKHDSVTSARINLSTKRFNIKWNSSKFEALDWIKAINDLGFKASLYDVKKSEISEQYNERFLLKALAVAGFASGNLMLFSVPLWSSGDADMGYATRTFFHWLQAFIALPALAYAGTPFFQSAFAALKQGKTNMDVPISVAVILSTLISLYEIKTHGTHSYLDSGVMLLFFLLIGRYLETRARGQARSAAQDLLRSIQGMVRVKDENNNFKIIPIQDVQIGMILEVNVGEKIGADGIVLEGFSDLDTSLITGETRPKSTKQGEQVYAGTLNLTAPLSIKVNKNHETSLISEIIRIMEKSEQSQAKYVTLADRIARWYTPTVHFLALMTFLGWFFLKSTGWQESLLYAATVLIITCPCALGLAVPVVQVIASTLLMRKGILLKSGSALERLALIDTAIFDKTGTLTLGEPQLNDVQSIPQNYLKLAASMAAKSAHPLSKSLVKDYQGEIVSLDVQEIAGLGLEADYEGKKMRLGKGTWVAPEIQNLDASLEMYFKIEGETAQRFTFSDNLREDALQVIESLKQMGIRVILLSGDRHEVVEDIAQKLSISERYCEKNPIDKVNFIESLRQKGRHVMMVGDGLNDAPSLSAASISFSPSSGLDITQNSADIVYYGAQLAPILKTIKISRFTQVLVKHNFLLAIGYNFVAIPMAVLGYVTPLIAALAMSSSSILVILNSMRLKLLKI